MNDLILLGTKAIATDTWVKPDYELCVRLNIAWHDIHYYQSDYKWVDMGRLNIPYVNESPIFPTYRHEIKMTTWKGVNIFESAAYPDGTYMSVHGYEGDDWRLLIVGEDTDVRRRKLVGNVESFNDWVASIIHDLPTVESTFRHESANVFPDETRLRAVTRLTAEELIEILNREAIGVWKVIQHSELSYLRWVELQCEDDALLFESKSICGTNWQGFDSSDIVGQSQKTVASSKQLTKI